jgi:hypothetical protein
MHNIVITDGLVVCSCKYKINTVNEIEARRVAIRHATTTTIQELDHVMDFVMESGRGNVFTIVES